MPPAWGAGADDPHVHLREPGQEQKETMVTGAAAAAGGFAIIVAERTRCCRDTAADREAQRLWCAGGEAAG
jgi:dihydroorotase-like cyclic amidohydrolase